MPDFGNHDLRPEQLRDHRGRLHRRVQASHRAQRAARIKAAADAIAANYVDESGRTWPGLVTAKPDR